MASFYYKSWQLYTSIFFLLFLTECQAARPTEPPTNYPSLAPSRTPTVSPSRNPTQSPTKAPSISPTTAAPTADANAPTPSPTAKPTLYIALPFTGASGAATITKFEMLVSNQVVASAGSGETVYFYHVPAAIGTTVTIRMTFNWDSSYSALHNLYCPKCIRQLLLGVERSHVNNACYSKGFGAVLTGRTLSVSYTDDGTPRRISTGGSMMYGCDDLVNSIPSNKIGFISSTTAAPSIPSIAPTKAPSLLPTKPPTNAPSLPPTKIPTKAPSLPPTKTPTNAPSLPTKAPSVTTMSPSFHPSTAPTIDTDDTLSSLSRGNTFVFVIIAVGAFVFCAIFCTVCRSSQRQQRNNRIGAVSAGLPSKNWSSPETPAEAVAMQPMQPIQQQNIVPQQQAHVVFVTADQIPQMQQLQQVPYATPFSAADAYSAAVPLQAPQYESEALPSYDEVTQEINGPNEGEITHA